MPPGLFDFGMFQIGKTYVAKSVKPTKRRKQRETKGPNSEQ